MTNQNKHGGGVARKIDGEGVTRINFLNIRHLVLQVFEGESKTRNVLPYPKICERGMLHASTFRATAYREKSSVKIVPCNITLNNFYFDDVTSRANFFNPNLGNYAVKFF